MKILPNVLLLKGNVVTSLKTPCSKREICFVTDEELEQRRWQDSHKHETQYCLGNRSLGRLGR